MTTADQDTIRKIIREELRLILFGAPPVTASPGHEAEKKRCLADVKAKIAKAARS